MPTDKPRVMLTLDPETHALLQDVADATDLSVSGIISRLLGAHLHELSEYHEWLIERKRDARAQMFAKNLLQSYGPENLIEAIRRVDPKHKFLSERIRESIASHKDLSEQIQESIASQKDLSVQIRESFPKSRKKK